MDFGHLLQFLGGRGHVGRYGLGSRRVSRVVAGHQSLDQPDAEPRARGRQPEPVPRPDDRRPLGLAGQHAGGAHERGANQGATAHEHRYDHALATAHEGRHALPLRFGLVRPRVLVAEPHAVSVEGLNEEVSLGQVADFLRVAAGLAAAHEEPHDDHGDRHPYEEAHQPAARARGTIRS